MRWSEEEVRREFEILREEVSAAIQRRIPPRHPEVQLDDAFEAALTFVTAAERIALEPWPSAYSVAGAIGFAFAAAAPPPWCAVAGAP